MQSITINKVRLDNLITLQLTIHQEEKITMPEHVGSMLRGAFGVALRDLTCVTGLSQCKACSVKQDCKFPQIFENTAYHTTGIQAVNPYIIHVPKREKTNNLKNHKSLL